MEETKRVGSEDVVKIKRFGPKNSIALNILTQLRAVMLNRDRKTEQGATVSSCSKGT